jgi:hypothetical protein
VSTDSRAPTAREMVELAREGARQAIARMIELIGHEDARIAMAAASAVLERAFGKSAPPIDDLDKPPAGDPAAAPTVEALARLSAGDRAELRSILARAAGRSEGDGPAAAPRRRARKP